MAPPSHISTRPTFTTATIGLQGQNAAENSCVINAATLDCSNDNGDSFARQVSVDDNIPRLFSVVLDNLEQDTIYTCDARLENSAAGNEFRFRTGKLSKYFQFMKYNNSFDFSAASRKRFNYLRY